MRAATFHETVDVSVMPVTSLELCSLGIVSYTATVSYDGLGEKTNKMRRLQRVLWRIFYFLLLASTVSLWGKWVFARLGKPGIYTLVLNGSSWKMDVTARLSSGCTVNCTAPPSRPLDCKSKQHPTNIVFLKIHKSGSTTVANILARYALTHDLNVALPNKPINAIRSNYFEAGSFREDQVQPIAVGQQYHVLFNHMIFNSTALKHLMPPDTFYLTIMREPTKRFESAVHYYNILSLPKVVDTLNSLLKKQMFADILGKPSALAHNGLDTFDAKCNETDKINNPIRCLTSTKPSTGKNYTKGEDIFTGKTSLPSHLQKLEDTKNSGNKFDKSLLRVLATRLLDLPMSGTSSGPHTKIALRPRVSAEFVSKAEDDTSSARSKTDPRVMQMLRQLMNDAATSLRQQQQHNNGSLSALLRKDIRESLQVPEIYNSIAFNSGLPLNRQKDEKAVTEHIAKLDHEFHLVMIMERFDESLILLKRKACLELRDIVYFKLNAVVKGRSHRLTDDDRKVLRDWQMADHVIYEFFLKKFQSEVEAMGEDFRREVLHFQGILKRLRNFCDTLAKFVDVLVVKASVWNEEFTLGARDCDMMKLDEMMFQAMLSVRAAQRLDLATTRSSSSLNKVT